MWISKSNARINNICCSTMLITMKAHISISMLITIKVTTYVVTLRVRSKKSRKEKTDISKTQQLFNAKESVGAMPRHPAMT